MDELTFKTVGNLRVPGTRWQSLPSAAFRKVNAGYSESTGRTEEIAETLALLGGDIIIDRVFEKVTNMIEDPVVTQVRMKAESVGRVFNNYFINGDLAVDPDGFEGLKKRVSNMPARMTINIDDNSAGTGDVLNLFDATAATALINQHKFIDALHIAKKRVMGSSDDHGRLFVVGNEAAYLGLGQVARRMNLYEQRTDALGKEWDMIAGMKILDIGYTSDLSTEIITSTEDPGDAGADSTSIYVVRMGGNGGLMGLQLIGTSPMAYDPKNGGEMETKPSKIRRVDWGVGLANLSQFCICRIKGFGFIA